MLNRRQVRWKSHIEVFPCGIGHEVLAFPEKIVMMGDAADAGRVAILVDPASGRQFLSLALELLNLAHGDGRGGPVDDQRKTDGIGGGKRPGMGIGSQRGVLAAKRHCWLGTPFGQSLKPGTGTTGQYKY